ncbi:MAG: hypothetical protein MUO76_22920 [Anaerolineaceae bacterium]|nr:hypothetical protein [Anaerolineaceae bacterium]
MKTDLIQPEIMTSLQDIKKLAEQEGNEWILDLYIEFLDLFELAKEPEGKELNTDLYVMF